MSRNKNIEPDFKDVEIDGKKYKIEKIPAMTACWIATKLITKIMPMIKEMRGTNKEDINEDAIADGLAKNNIDLTEKEFYDLQSYCLMACKRYEDVGEDEVALPVMAGIGKFAIPELKYNLAVVLGLTSHVIAYNVSSFFTGGALKTLQETFKDLPLFSIQP